MTAKRFTHKKWYDERQLLDGKEVFAIVDCGVQASILCNKLNKLSDENEQLKKRKARYKLLSEIRDEEINNRIFTIKEFIDNCSNEEVKKALADLFYSEVNEYDLSKKYRKLHEENEKLKQSHNEAIEFILDGIVEMHDGKRDYAETLFNKAIKLLKEDLE